MSNTEPMDLITAACGPVVHTYTRAEALADGVLVDAGPLAKEAGFRWPVALTAAAWADSVAWTAEDSVRQVYQDLTGRLWDVLYLAAQTVRSGRVKGDRTLFRLYRVPRDRRSTQAVLATLKLVVGPGDDGQPVVNILLPDED